MRILRKLFKILGKEAKMIKERLGRIAEIMKKITGITPKGFIRTYSINLNFCFGYTEKGVSFKFYAPSDNFLMLQVSSEDPDLIAVFTEALGYQPCFHYINETRFFVFEWVGGKKDDRLKVLEEEQNKGNILKLKTPYN